MGGYCQGRRSAGSPWGAAAGLAAVAEGRPGGDTGAAAEVRSGAGLVVTQGQRWRSARAAGAEAEIRPRDGGGGPAWLPVAVRPGELHAAPSPDAEMGARAIRAQLTQSDRVAKNSCVER